MPHEWISYLHGILRVLPAPDLYPERVVSVEAEPGLVLGQAVEPADLLGRQLAHLLVAARLGGLGVPRAEVGDRAGTWAQ